MNRKFDFSAGEFYHLYSRGVDRRTIFKDDKDRARFLTLLYTANSDIAIHLSNFSKHDIGYFYSYPRGKQLVHIGAYCIMPNHFHLLIHDPSGENVSVFMRKILTAYSMYFNRKYHRTGALFESRFKAQHVDSDEYLKYLFAYIHLNPIKLIDPKWKKDGIADKRRAGKYLSAYEYSSYLDYCEQGRKEVSIIDRSAFPGYFEKNASFQAFVSWWLNFKREI